DCCVKGMIVAYETLVIVAVADSGFVNPLGTRNPGPGSRPGLRSRVLHIEKVRIHLGGWTAQRKCIALAQEIHAFDGVVVAEVIVELRESTINRIVAGQGRGYGSAGIGID